MDLAWKQKERWDNKQKSGWKPSGVEAADDRIPSSPSSECLQCRRSRGKYNQVREFFSDLNCVILMDKFQSKYLDCSGYTNFDATEGSYLLNDTVVNLPRPKYTQNF